VNTGHWWLGHKVVIPLQWIREMNWSDATVSVGPARQGVKDAPPYISAAELNRQQEIAIYKHHGNIVYSAEERKREVAEPA
jgi:hypothetical protein